MVILIIIIQNWKTLSHPLKPHYTAKNVKKTATAHLDVFSKFINITSFLGILKKWFQIFGMLMESWILRVSSQKTQSIHDSMKIPKIEFIAYIYILF